MVVRFFGVMVGILLSAMVYAQDPQLEVPEYFEVLSINGQDVKGNLLHRTRQYNLAAGDTILELRYNDLINVEIGDSHTIYRSSPIAVRFSAAADRRYGIEAKRPVTEQEAAAFSKAPQLQLVDLASKQAVPQQYVNAVALKKSVLAAQLPATDPAVAPALSAQSAAVPASDLVVQNLLYWWQQADEPTRQAFLKRIGR